MNHSWFFCWGVKVRCIVESNEICGTVKLLMNTTLNFSWFNWRKLGEAAGILHWKWNAGKHITASCSPTELRPLDNHPTLTILYMYCTGGTGGLSRTPGSLSVVLPEPHSPGSHSVVLSLGVDWKCVENAECCNINGEYIPYKLTNPWMAG